MESIEDSSFLSSSNSPLDPSPRSCKTEERGVWLKLVSVAVEASPVGTINKPPAAVDERISKDGRHDSGDVAPSLAKTSSLQGRSGGSAMAPKLFEVFGPSFTCCAVVQLSPCIAWTVVAAPSVRSRFFRVCLPVCLHGKTWLPSAML